MHTLVTKTYKETQNAGIKLADKLKQGGVVALFGNLGSGKTTFVQGLAKGLGIKQKIISPTFIIARKYDVPKSSLFNHKSFYHIDLYRIESEKDILGLGLTEIINDKENIVAIEWPEKIEKILPKERTDIYFEYELEDKRKIRII